jgi:hypothetical protein
MIANNYIKVAKYGTDGECVDADGNIIPRTRVDSHVYPFNDRDEHATEFAYEAARLCVLNMGGGVLSVWRPIKGVELPVIGYGGGLT